ncbi:MAG: serine hydrolase domain-containing protein [Pseudomonadota bacterium]
MGAYGIDLPAGRWTVSLPDHARGQAWNDSFVAFAPGKPVDTIITAGETTELPALSLDATPRPVTTLGEPGRLFRWSAENEPEFERLVAELMTYYEVPGASIALVKDGALVYHNVFGTQNAYTGEPVKPETLFEAASITKIVFAFVVNRMAERGEIDLDKPLYEYLPFEELAYDERYRKITARHALSHQTGMPNWRWQNDDGEIDLKFYPGIQFGYSGEGYEYLGRVVAHLMGKPLAQVLMEEVQQPMGFTEKTFFSDSDELRAVASRGHYSGLATPHSFAGEPGMAFSMVTEASVFSNFMISLMARKGLSAEGYTAMFEPQIAVPPDDEDDEGEWPSRYGLGFHMMNSPVGLVWGHGGNNGDFVCMFEAYDAQNAGFIIFTNANSGIGLVDGLREYLVVGEEPDEAVARVD